MFFIKIAIYGFIYFFISFNLSFASNNLEWSLVREYKENGKTFRHFSTTKIVASEDVNDSILKSISKLTYQSYLKDDGTKMLTIDGGLNWYGFRNNQKCLVNFKLYPNPSSNVININLFNLRQNIKAVTIMDMHGNDKGNFIGANTKLNLIDIHLLPKGMYLLSLETLCGKKGSMNFIKN
jgi:hypothetical protein